MAPRAKPTARSKRSIGYNPDNKPGVFIDTPKLMDKVLPTDGAVDSAFTNLSKAIFTPIANLVDKKNGKKKNTR